MAGRFPCPLYGHLPVCDPRSLFPGSCRHQIVELSRGKFYRYQGNYTDFLLARAARQVVEELQESQRQKFLKRELEWVRRSPSARRTKSINRVEQYFELAAVRRRNRSLTSN